MNQSERRGAVDRIIQNVDEALARAEPARESNRLSAAISFLNSSFTVTVLGGLLLWAIGALWQNTQAQIDAETQRQLQRYARREKLLLEFASEFPYTLRLARDYKLRELWLAEKKGNRAAVYPDYRDFVQTRNLWEQTLTQYLQRKSPYAFAAEIEVTYDDVRTRHLARQLAGNMRILQDAEGKDHINEIRRASLKLDELYRQLILAMGRAVTGKGESS